MPRIKIGLFALSLFSGTSAFALEMDTDGSNVANLTVSGITTLNGNLQLVSGSTIAGSGSIALSSASTPGASSNIGIQISTYGSVHVGSRIDLPAFRHTAGLKVAGLGVNGGGAILSLTDNGGGSRLDIESCSGVGICYNTPQGVTQQFQVGTTAIVTFDTSGGQPVTTFSQASNCNTRTPTAIGELCAQNSATAPHLISTGTTGTAYAPVVWKSTETTWAGTALLGTNSPATSVGAPYVWIELISDDGSKVYLPAWK